MQLRLSPDQVEAKKALEAAVSEVKEEIEGEQDAEKKELLAVELKDREQKLDDLMTEFEVRCHTTLTSRCSYVFAPC